MAMLQLFNKSVFLFDTHWLCPSMATNLEFCHCQRDDGYDDHQEYDNAFKLGQGWRGPCQQGQLQGLLDHSCQARCNIVPAEPVHVIRTQHEDETSTSQLEPSSWSLVAFHVAAVQAECRIGTTPILPSRYESLERTYPAHQDFDIYIGIFAWKKYPGVPLQSSQ